MGEPQEQQQLLEAPEEFQLQKVPPTKSHCPLVLQMAEGPGGGSSSGQPKHLNPSSGKLNWGQ